MKRITVITPANGVWTLAKQPFHRCLLLASLQGVICADSPGGEPRLSAKITDQSGNVIWLQSRTIAASSTENVVFAASGVETLSQSFGRSDNFTCPLPDDLTIPANLEFTLTLEGYANTDTTPNLVVTTDDPFLDGARPFDDLQAP